MPVVAVAASATSCAVPVKTRTGWENRAKGIAADIGKPANDQSGAMCAANCALLASIRINWASKAKGIAVDIARRAEAAKPMKGCHGVRAEASDTLTRALPLATPALLDPCQCLSQRTVLAWNVSLDI
jgi:hypothetical protein